MKNFKKFTLQDETGDVTASDKTYVLLTYSESEAAQIFENRFDCYADTWIERDGKMIEGDAVMAMTKDCFIEVLKELNVII